MLLMASVPLPVLVKTVVLGLLEALTFTAPKARAAGLSSTKVPTPLREIVCGLPATLSVMDNVPARLPAVAGVNVTLIVQLATEGRLAGQLLVCPKFPLTAIPVMPSALVP